MHLTYQKMSTAKCVYNYYKVIQNNYGIIPHTHDTHTASTPSHPTPLTHMHVHITCRIHKEKVGCTAETQTISTSFIYGLNRIVWFFPEFWTGNLFQYTDRVRGICFSITYRVRGICFSITYRVGGICFSITDRVRGICFSITYRVRECIPSDRAKRRESMLPLELFLSVWSQRNTGVSRGS